MFFNIDKIFVLSLIKHKDSVKKKFNTIFSENREKLSFEFVRGVGSNKNDGQFDSNLFSILQHSTVDDISMNIFHNHIQIIKKAVDLKLNQICILEDDAIFDSISEQKMETINRWLDEHEWDIFYLGYCNWPYIVSFPTLTPGIIRPMSPLTAHGYLVSKSGMTKILDILMKEPKNKLLHIDKFYAQTKDFKKYGIFPMICHQDKNPALFLKACDKMNLKNIEFKRICQCNEWISIIIFLILVFIFVIFIFFSMKMTNTFFVRYFSQNGSK